MTEYIYILQRTELNKDIVTVGNLEHIKYFMSRSRAMHSLDFEYKFKVPHGWQLERQNVSSLRHMGEPSIEQLFDRYGYMWYLNEYTGEVYKCTRFVPNRVKT